MPSRHLVLACTIFLAASWFTSARGAEDDRIDRLIRQLGSTRFTERESAMQALQRIGGPALPALKKAASSNADAEVRRRAAELVSRIENSLDQLLADYKRFGLPLAPEKSPLVRFMKQSSRQIGAVGPDGAVTITIPPIYALGFIVEPAMKGRTAKVLHGTQTYRSDAKDVGHDLDPERLTLEYVEANLSSGPEALVVALQMHARRWPAAEDVFEYAIGHETEGAPRTALRSLAWDYWNDRLLDPATDWPKACRYMKVLLADGPGLDIPEHHELVRSLEASLVPRKVKPGSVEARIGDLTSVRDVSFSDEHFTRALDLGFDAMPVLLQYLDDHRLTHYRFTSQYSQFNGRSEPPYHYRVRDVAGALIQLIAGDTASRDWRRDDPSALKRQAAAWWEKARRQGEEAYLLAHVLPQVRKEEPRQGDPLVPTHNEDKWPDYGHVRLLGKKYPRQLAQLYRNVLESRPHMQTFPIVDAIAASAIPRNEKLELCALGAANRTLDHRHPALSELEKLDRERFVALLIATLENLPRTPAERYPDCIEARLAGLACRTDDPRAWRALDRAARKADTGLRMEMLKNTEYPKPTPTQRRLRLSFLAGYLDDDAVRDATKNDEKFAGICAGFGYPRIEVRNFVALRIAQILGPIDDPPRDWSADEWAKLRARMRAALKRELGE